MGSKTINYPPGWKILFSETGWVFLRTLQTQRRNGSSFLDLNKNLRAQKVATDEAAALINQLELQEKGTTKFGDYAYDLLFTKSGLEQASRLPVGLLHATAFHAAGFDTVTDLGSGIGAQSLAFAQQGLNVHAVEIDPLVSECASHNLKLFSNATPTVAATVTTADATAFNIPANSAVFLDPARRTSGHKNTTRVAPSDYSPTLNFAFEKAIQKGGAVKLGPGFAHEQIPDTANAQWISMNGDVLENVLWFGRLQETVSKRQATILLGSITNHEVHHLAAAEPRRIAEQRDIADYLYEPDGAVIRAELIGLLAEQLAGGMLDQNIAYITSNKPAKTPFATGFRILEEAPTKVKQLAKFLRTKNVGTLEIKKRGVAHDPHVLRKTLALSGTESATLIMTRVGQKHQNYLVERI